MKNTIVCIGLLGLIVSCKWPAKKKMQKSSCVVKEVQKFPPPHSLTPEPIYKLKMDCGITLSSKKRFEVGDSVYFYICDSSEKN